MILEVGLSKRNRETYTNAIVILFIFLIAISIRIITVDFDRQIANYSDSSAYDYAAKNILKYGVITNDRDGAMYRGEREVVPTSTLQLDIRYF